MNHVNALERAVAVVEREAARRRARAGVMPAGRIITLPHLPDCPYVLGAVQLNYRITLSAGIWR